MKLIIKILAIASITFSVVTMVSFVIIRTLFFRARTGFVADLEVMFIWIPILTVTITLLVLLKKGLKSSVGANIGYLVLVCLVVFFSIIMLANMHHAGLVERVSVHLDAIYFAGAWI